MTSTLTKCLLTMTLGTMLAAGCAGPDELLRGDQVARGDRETIQAGVSTQPIETQAPASVDDPHAVWNTRRAKLLDQQQWNVFGKLALRSNDEGWTASLQWRQTGEAYRIRLTGPFGGGGLQIEGDSSGVEVRTADNQTYTADDPEQVLYEQLGWEIPLSGLRYWILGRVEPGNPVDDVFIDVAGRLLRFDQAGWHVKYHEYQDVDDFAMPRKASLERDGVKASVLLTRWELPPNPE